jgi:glycosyltransferase involved in cell wall biosynthesis
MKVVMVNDCAYVGGTILKYLPKNVEAEHIKRTRGAWSKTFGIAYKVWRAKADVYHVHYLLQDCYLASVFKKRPLIGHAHGSDLIITMNRFPLGRIVKNNLKRCDKILVSTPDLMEIAQQYREDVQYMPNPVDTELFYPKPKSQTDRLKILIASEADWTVKRTDIIVQALAKLRAKIEISMIAYGRDLEKTVALVRSLGLKVNLLPKVPHQNMNEYYWNADLVIGQGRFNSGVLGLVSLEAIACGRPVIANISSKYEAYRDFPLKDVDTVERTAEAIEKSSPKLWKAECDYLKQNHDPQKIVTHLMEIYQEVLNFVI